MAIPSYRVGDKAVRPLPPENGSFPLDHQGFSLLHNLFSILSLVIIK